jgi:3-methyladenine DNA glycosylase AlkD
MSMPSDCQDHTNPEKVVDWRGRLNKLARGNEEYAEFNRRIVKTSLKIIGVRLPDLRRLAKDLAYNQDFTALQNFIKFADKKVYEEILLCGLIINYAKLATVKRIQLTRQFLPYVDNWAAVDCCAIRLAKASEQDRELWWKFAMNCLSSMEEFIVRYGVVLLMKNFINDDKLYKVLRQVKHDGYYVKMAIAWLYATAAVKDFDQTLAEVNRPGLDPWIYRKALTKMLESYRFTPEQKLQIRNFRDITIK